MSNSFFISDTHFGHEKTWKDFKNPDGTPLRPFTSTKEMDETMIDNWNKVVRPQDMVYHLGDVVINRKELHILSRLNGKLKLIKGNHDIFKLKDYLPYFDDICAYKMFPKLGIVCSHIPLHEQQLENRFKFNVHGHLHNNIIKNKNTIPDKRYFNVSVERINYTPISLEELLLKLGVEK